MEPKQKVLIVDDDSRNQRIVIEIIEDQVEFRTASSGEDALSVAREFQPDLVLLDIMMPGIDGYEVCKRMREDPQLQSTKVILVSGKAMVDERLKGYAVGADDYMTKPFVPEELLAKAKVFLRLSRAEKALSDLNQSLDGQVKERTRQLLETEGKLVNAAKMSALGEMAGGIAHEVNTPLGTIGMIVDQVAELAAEEPVDGKVIAKRLQIAKTTIRRISTIINGLRTFSRDGNQDPFDTVSMRQVLDNTLTLCQERLKNDHVKLEIAPFSEDLAVRCRPVQISQVLINLIGNACDAIRDLSEKWVRLSVEKKGEFIEISVTDSGKGISEAVRAKLFQPFFTTKAIGKGTGLGLSISKGIVDAHGGSLELDRQAENTRFVLKLPEYEGRGNGE